MTPPRLHSLFVAIITVHVLFAVPLFAQQPKLYTAKETNEDGTAKRTYTYYKGANNVRVKHGYELHYYPSGKKHRKMVFSKGQYHGAVASWFESDQQDMQGEYSRGKKVGTWTAWYADGSPRHVMNYQEGVLHGAYKTWYPEKKPHVETSYNKGKRHGSYVEWHENGTRSREMTYANGERDGTALIYHPNGRKQTEFTYKGGELNGVVRRWDEDGKQIADGILKDGKPVSGIIWEPGDRENEHYLSTYVDGVIVDALLFEGGQPKTGTVTEWHVTGGKWRECQYYEGRKHGTEKWWFPSGKPHSKCVWKENRLNGTYVEYFEAGPKKFDVECKDGIKHGRERTYDVQRGMLADGEYRDGKPWSGTLVMTGTQPVIQFKNGDKFRTTEAITYFQEYIDGVPQKLDKDGGRGKTFTLPSVVARPKRADEGLDESVPEEPDPFKKSPAGPLIIVPTQ